jgi:hypothetical protein
MMVEVVCEGCGADVRDGSLFCYACGERIAAKADEPEATPEPRGVAEPPAKEAITPPSPPLPETKPKLRSAASLRRQRRAFNRQPLEIRWERPAGLGIGFVLTTIILATGALVLILIALYLR